MVSRSSLLVAALDDARFLDGDTQVVRQPNNLTDERRVLSRWRQVFCKDCLLGLHGFHDLASAIAAWLNHNKYKEQWSAVMDWRDYIHSDSNVLLGKPVVKGTRLSVEFLLGLFAVGWTE